MRLIQIVGLALVVLPIVATPTGATHVQLTGLECHNYDPSFCIFDKCIIKAPNRDTKEMSIAVKMLQLPVTNVTIRGDIKPRFKPVFYSYEIDACVFMSSNNRNPIANAVYKFLRLEVFSNMNHSCPYNHDVIVDRMRIDKNFNLPLPLAAGEYVISSQWRILNVLRATTHLIFAVSG